MSACVPLFAQKVGTANGGIHFSSCHCGKRDGLFLLPIFGRSTKKAGLKIVVAFCHREFELEVWLSGVNRKAQWEWAQKLSKAAYTGQLTDDPKHTDYILRLPVESDLADGEKTAAAVQAAAMKMLGQIG